MAKQLTFSYNGKDYVLEFTRNTVRQMESGGFIADDIDTKPMTVLPALFAGAFLAHHRFEKQSVIEEIYSKMKDKMRKCITSRSRPCWMNPKRETWSGRRVGKWLGVLTIGDGRRSAPSTRPFHLHAEV